MKFYTSCLKTVTLLTIFSFPILASAGFYGSIAAKGGLGNSATEDEELVESRDLYRYGAELNLGWHWSTLVAGVSADYVLWNQKTKASEVDDTNMSGKQLVLSPIVGLSFGKILVQAKVPLQSTMTLNQEDAGGNKVVLTTPAFPAYSLQINYRLEGSSYVGVEYTKTTYKTMEVDGEENKLSDENQITYSGWGLVYGYVF